MGEMGGPSEAWRDEDVCEELPGRSWVRGTEEGHTIYTVAYGCALGMPRAAFWNLHFAASCFFLVLRDGVAVF